MRLGINGFGRIGRLTYRALRRSGRDIDLVAVNDLTDGPTLAHLLKYDSVHGRLDADVSVKDGALMVGDDELRVLSERDPAKLPWGDLGIDVVIESTGRFKDRDQAAQQQGRNQAGPHAGSRAEHRRNHVTTYVGADEAVYGNR